MLPEFRNEPLIDFAAAAQRTSAEEARAVVQARFGETGRLLIDGEWIAAPRVFPSLDPSTPGSVVGYFADGGFEGARQAIDAAARAFETWRFRAPAERMGYLLKAAAVMRRRRLELAATMVHEVGKTWPEADADVAEAIDFCEFYAREALRWANPDPLTPVTGEANELAYIPLGVGAIIPPWNFPLAILCGMTAAALVTGNTVVLKPSENSPAVGLRFAEILHQDCRLPAGVFNFVTGDRLTVGETLVTDPRTRFIAFTGSRATGLSINQKAAEPRAGQRWIKRTILEMGGKDAIIVDDTADLDLAAAGIVTSAFGYQGQKCSACSRLIVLQPVHDQLLARVVERTRALQVGPAWEWTTDVGPLINPTRYEAVLDYIGIGRQEGSVVCGGGRAPGDGLFVEPTIVDGVAPDARIAQEEIFGPVLAVITARDFDEAIEIANGTDYGLTGALYTRRRDRITEAQRRFHVGNLYVNRKCTGALVGGHPFGGFNLSGTDSKAGGRDYLGLFLQAKVWSEKL